MVSQGSLGSTSVSGGAGGGVYYGGRGGNNSLIGGAGSVTLIGGGSGDFLQANSSHGENELVAGTGRETLTASSDTRNNIFLVDGSSQDMVSSAGFGEQDFLLGDSVGGNCTITGATAAGSINIFDIIGDATSGGANYILKNFVSSNSSIYLTNNDANGAGDATVSSIEVDPTFGIGNTLVVLSDQTEIHLLGVSSVVQGVNPIGIPYLY
jgi:hypothetical protein